MLHAVLKFEIETKGQCCKFWNNGQNIKISLNENWKCLNGGAQYHGTSQWVMRSDAHHYF